ncbi:glycosyltransferase [Desulfocurvibacter africanus]|uniref:Glycosyl transferase family 2 n=1 Tax=Desulfocurvibacter africanus subsp. africanus str. Walvis Bay TaxID=690850 RepID=F3YXP8_DESAF|nr:glycosyltransferase [Desulfocurvibacter africanus]EGJ49492.1 glycosyl transferase family 2 [Desulfocurvibacter africanus subsp. africanus str. Walvis Bay]
MTLVKRSPPLTVIMPVYNTLHFLPAAVDSILRQSLGDFEFIIIDDGSTDGSSDYLATLRDKRVRIMRQKNRGQGNARNAALWHTSTPFLALMDADDISHPLRLEKQLRFLQKHQDVGMLGTGFQYIGASGRKGLSPPLPDSHDEIMSHLLRMRHALVNATIMARTHIVREIGGYRIEGFGEDWDFFLRMGERTRLANLNETLFYYRVNTRSSTYKRFHEMRLRFGYSVHCAERRRQGLPELGWEAFMAHRSSNGALARLLEAMDEHALYQYKLALDDLLDSRQARGWLRLGYAAMSSPRLTAQRLRRGCSRFVSRIKANQS